MGCTSQMAEKVMHFYDPRSKECIVFKDCLSVHLTANIYLAYNF